ncbi:MAG: hypothetical protein K2J11_01025 [Oscillospiraceae bacterium]|nr:hypothetical protein [Oscillospiraceae bacterium]
MKKSPPCPECPYKLGLVETFENPCLQCGLDDYITFEAFKNLKGYYNHKHANDKPKDS